MASRFITCTKCRASFEIPEGANGGVCPKCGAEVPAPKTIGCWLFGCFAASGIILFLAVVGILTAMLLPALSQARTRAREVQCMSNLKQIGLSMAQYETKFGMYPPADNEDGFDMLCAFNQDIPDKIFTCPAFAHENGEDETSYLYFGGTVLKKCASPASTVLAMDYPGNHDKGVNVLYADGHVAFVSLPEDAMESVESAFRAVCHNQFDTPEKKLQLEKAKKFDKAMNGDK